MSQIREPLTEDTKQVAPREGRRERRKEREGRRKRQILTKVGKRKEGGRH